tara:strand:- start:200 stop:379 length:180 start_codon:yes stop_codon:yes gene_type:complete
LPYYKDPIISPEFLVPFPVTLPAIGSIGYLFVGQTAQIKSPNPGIPVAMANVLITQLTH